MYYSLIPLLLTLVLLWPQISVAAALEVPPLMLARTATHVSTLEHYWISEKLDGVRGYWNGQQLLTRSGRGINAPTWFLEALPNVHVDGELWLGRGRFNEVSALIRRNRSEDELWTEVFFKAFDLPNHSGNYAQRMSELDEWVWRTNVPWFSSIERIQLNSKFELDNYLGKVVDEGGEGLMLNDSLAVYSRGRTDAILKLKPIWDDEAEVIGYTAGKGKYKGLMGALIVRMRDGREFKIGTGFSEQVRKNPPSLGSWITFEYSGVTSSGLPRFARYRRPYIAL